MNHIHLLNFETFDGSGEVVHPDRAAIPPGWASFRHTLAITPYPRGNDTFEMPSVFFGDNGKDWVVPPGLTNPIAHPMTPYAYLSDPDELFNLDTKELWLYFRQVRAANEIYLVRSRDGISWSAPTLVASAPNHDLISPSVVRVGRRDWRMWSVNAKERGCQSASTTVEMRRSVDGVTWSAPRTVALRQPGLYAWHIEVAWIPRLREFWALYNAKTPGSCNTRALYMATSKDGVQWTVYPSPVLTRGAIPEFQDIVYRSTFAYHPASDEVTLWYSGARFDGVKDYAWRAAVQRRSRSDLFAQMRAPFTPATQVSPGRGRRRIPPRLNNSTAP